MRVFRRIERSGGCSRIKAQSAFVIAIRSDTWGEAALSISWLEAALLTGQQSFIGLISTTEKVEIPVSNLSQWGHLQLLQTVQSHLQRVTQRPPHHPRKAHDAETRIQTPIPPGR